MEVKSILGFNQYLASFVSIPKYLKETGNILVKPKNWFYLEADAVHNGKKKKKVKKWWWFPIKQLHRCSQGLSQSSHQQIFSID